MRKLFSIGYVHVTLPGGFDDLMVLTLLNEIKQYERDLSHGQSLYC